MGTVSRSKARNRRKRRVRKTVFGSNERPRLSVFRSAKHIYAQVIDDTTGITLVQASSVSKEARASSGGKGGNKEGASSVGAEVAKRAKEKGISKVVFDRNGFLYHGRVKALAEAAREEGLQF